MVNQAGEPVVEDVLYPDFYCAKLTDVDRDAAIALLCAHLGVQIVRTNATKHGNTQIVLRKEE